MFVGLPIFGAWAPTSPRPRTGPGSRANDVRYWETLETLDEQKPQMAPPFHAVTRTNVYRLGQSQGLEAWCVDHKKLQDASGELRLTLDMGCGCFPSQEKHKTVARDHLSPSQNPTQTLSSEANRMLTLSLKAQTRKPSIPIYGYRFRVCWTSRVSRLRLEVSEFRNAQTRNPNVLHVEVLREPWLQRQPHGSAQRMRSGSWTRHPKASGRSP